MILFEVMYVECRIWPQKWRTGGINITHTLQSGQFRQVMNKVKKSIRVSDLVKKISLFSSSPTYEFRNKVDLPFHVHEGYNIANFLCWCSYYIFISWNNSYN